MKKIRPLNRFWLLLFFIIPVAVFAQDRTITGKVVDEMNQPLPGASVKVTGGASTSTDVNGTFRVRVSEDAVTLSIAFIGYATKEVTVAAGQTSIDIALVPSARSLEEVVVVGYGTQRRRDVTGAVSSISGETLREVPSANFQQALQGRVAGVEIQKVGTNPGAGARIRIRGVRSISGSNDPLLVLDGIPYEGSISDINSDDIASTEILKDASATAIYGSRGANGVVLITTKRGKEGPTRVSFSSYYGLSTVARRYEVFNAEEYRAMRDISPWVDGYIPEEIEGIAQGRNTNWQDLVYKDGLMTDNNITVSGGSAQSRFSIGSGYFKQTAVLPGQDYTRGSLRANADFNVGKRVTVGLTSLNSLGVASGTQNPLDMYPLLSLSPLTSPYNADGTINVRPAGSQIDKPSYYNPLIFLNEERDVDRVRRFRTFNTLYGEVKIIDGLKYRANVGLSFVQANTAVFLPADTETQPSYYRIAQGNTARVNNEQQWGYTFENLLSYEKTFAKKHRISATALFSVQEQQGWNTQVSKDSINADFIQFYDLSQSNQSATNAADLSGGENAWGLVSYMARAFYSYDDRYLITLTGRVDGSSRLADKWAQYPAVSVGWNISNEQFMRGIQPVSNLKLRLSTGTTSNQSVNPYTTLGGVTSGTIRYNYGTNELVQGYSVSSLPDKTLEWEFTKSSNVGLDFGFLDNRITGSIEWYKQKTTGILYAVGLPPSSGIAGSFTTNVGSMKNHGMEFSISTDNIRAKKDRGFSWSTDFNAFFNKNKLLSLNSGFTRDIPNQLHIGQPLSVIYDYKKLGIWQLDEALEAAKFGQVPGQLKLADISGPDGVPDGRITEDYDRTYVGNGDPKVQGGITNRFSYKGFDLDIVAYARLGGTLVSQLHQPSSAYLTVNDGRRNGLKVDYWTPSNPTNDFPMPSTRITPPQATSAWTTLGYYDASFVKIRTINLGYTFSNMLTQKVGAQRMRLYVSVQDPFILFSPYIKKGGMDPEPTSDTGNSGVGNPPNLRSGAGQANRALVIGATAPALRTFLAGINVSF
ncbi:SusC/RagA family TonB-linked outer membrane protein [Desertivirga xinjiangensis]|uniref:SusC/RagA family TonB-linked outer membrane protein n=1 Tax=Desertivirga xinjiangensis TaxID=539206 RepID=UPI00210C5627|nr:TonB-dependent receptor [Pedobacter xinjiangensis]